jgi:hypothetical protein
MLASRCPPAAFGDQPEDITRPTRVMSTIRMVRRNYTRTTLAIQNLNYRLPPALLHQDIPSPIAAPLAIRGQDGNGEIKGWRGSLGVSQSSIYLPCRRAIIDLSPEVVGGILK